MNELKNQVFVQDRMERNLDDYYGSGNGSGRYDAGYERTEKLKDLVLPMVLLGFLILYWIVVAQIAAEDIYHKFNSTKHVVEFKDYQDRVFLDLPDGREVEFRISSEFKGDGKLTYYYNKKDDVIYVRSKKNSWEMFAVFGAVVTLLLLYWIKTILFRKKHAVEKPREHSYKDY